MFNQVKALEHYAYEWECLEFARMVLLNARTQDHRNIGINAMSLQARNLMDFYRPPGNVRSDDMAAVQFVRDWVQPEFSPEIRDRINKQIQHLTYKRGSNKITIGDLMEVHRQLHVAKQAFEVALGPAHG